MRVHSELLHWSLVLILVVFLLLSPSQNYFWAFYRPWSALIADLNKHLLESNAVFPGMHSSCSDCFRSDCSDVWCFRNWFFFLGLWMFAVCQSVQSLCPLLFVFLRETLTNWFHWSKTSSGQLLHMYLCGVLLLLLLHVLLSSSFP